MIIDFNWFSQPGVKNVLNMVYTILDILRIIVPIALIVMTTLDITKKVINPEDKEGQKKILIRAIAAVIVFLIPTIIGLIFRLANIEKVDVDTNVPQKTPAPLVTPTPVPTTVTCLSGQYLPSHSFVCEACPANYYCPGGIFMKVGDSSPSGLNYCGDGYTSSIGSDSLKDCIMINTPTPVPNNDKNTKCVAPTNLSISQTAMGAGTVRWNETSDVTGYEISINNNDWLSAYSGYNFKNVIIGDVGMRTVYVRSVCGNTKSNVISASVNVYKIEVEKGLGIDFVNGGGNYIEGETATISAVTLDNYTWNFWLSNTNENIKRQNYSFTVNSNKSFKAFAYK